MKRFDTDLRMLLHLSLSILMAGTLTACTGGKQVSGGSADQITQQQIQEAGTVSNAYVLVKRIHPEWLRKRGSSSLTQPSTISVYIEGNHRGGPDVLRQISVMDVESIEHLNSNEATLRYGSGHDHGVIRVELKMSG